jgi:hypothetical protein
MSLPIHKRYEIVFLALHPMGPKSVIVKLQKLLNALKGQLDDGRKDGPKPKI